ncbi:uncharacterized protein LOC129797252 [Lutzomyia longipalpis]|uniref:uncharacterized protein LOC129797252 n=1 Tax=Lutzomyia longipalpis TaxID=7200 RepID=UPI002483F011|nr:uncharacterized protein LOC129797252 [Lutzomyia longipalpis]XP_055695604.1 uncharacterized protein LOC129797252 [Lutzomyia longipalpis]
MDVNCENAERNGAANNSMNNTTSPDESTLYFSMNSSGDLGDLEKTMEIENASEPQISVEIPDFSLTDPLAICDKFLQKNAASLMSSTPNRIPLMTNELHKPSPPGETEMTPKPEEDKTLEEKNEDESTMNNDDSLKNVSTQVNVSLKQYSEIYVKTDKVFEANTDEASSQEAEGITEVEEYSIIRLKEDLIKIVIDEEIPEEVSSSYLEDKTAETEISKEVTEENPMKEDIQNADTKNDNLDHASLDGVDNIDAEKTPTEVATNSHEGSEVDEAGEKIHDKLDEDKENVKGNNMKKQRRRSKIAVSTSNKEQKVTGKQSLIRRSILKTDVRSPAKPAKTTQFNVPKRSSLLPKNLPGNQKRQTIGLVAKVSAPPAKPKLLAPAKAADPPMQKKRQTLMPNIGNPSGSSKRSPKGRQTLLPNVPIREKPSESGKRSPKARQTLVPSLAKPPKSGKISPKGILTTKTAPVVNKSPKFLHPKDIKPVSVNTFECKVCKKKFRTNLILETHMKTHKDTAKGGFLCKYCDRRFDIKHGLENHINRYCSKIPVGEKRRLLEEEAKNNALTPRTKRWIASKGSDVASNSSASSNSDLMTLLKHSPGSQGSKRRSVAFSGISATPNRTIKCYQCLKEFYDVFEFSDHIADHVAN